MATHSSILAWRIVLTEEPSGLWSLRSQKSQTWLSNSRTSFKGDSQWFSSKETACQAGDSGSIPGLGRSPREGNGNPFQYSCLGNPMDRGAQWAYIPWSLKKDGDNLVSKQPYLHNRSSRGSIEIKPQNPLFHSVRHLGYKILSKGCVISA